MKIAIGSDHAGFELKEAIKKYLIEKGYEVFDEGTDSLSSVDYPDYGAKVGQAVVSEKADLGIVCCGSAEGISIAANKIKGVRCGIGYNDEVSKLLRQHNDANVIVLPGRFIDNKTAEAILDEFFKATFEGGRHERRVKKIPLQK